MSTIENLTFFIAFMGGSNLISQFYNNRSDLLCEPLIKIIILYSIIYSNFKDIKTSILIFFIYILFIENYITNECTPTDIQGIKLNKNNNKKINS